MEVVYNYGYTFTAIFTNGIVGVGLHLKFCILLKVLLDSMFPALKSYENKRAMRPWIAHLSIQAKGQTSFE